MRKKPSYLKKEALQKYTLYSFKDQFRAKDLYRSFRIISQTDGKQSQT